MWRPVNSFDSLGTCFTCVYLRVRGPVRVVVYMCVC